MPVMFRGMAAKPETGSAGFHVSGPMLRTLTCTGKRPDWRHERVGEQNL